jgi:tetratricopeptide (TPR) repeat protein
MLADFDYQAGNNDKALEGYRKVVALDAENVTALNNLAFLTLEHLHNVDVALQLAQQAKVLDSENPSVEDTLGWVQYQKGSFKLAAASFQRAISRAPNARRMYHLAMAQFKAGNRSEGLKIFKKAYKLDPMLPEAETAMAASRQ